MTTRVTPTFSRPNRVRNRSCVSGRGGVTPPRPLTHDLFLTLFGRLKVGVTRVVINDLRGGVYYATLLLSVDGKEMPLDSRPSDAIALAIRAKAPVYVEDRVFEKSSAPLPLAPPGSRL